MPNHDSNVAARFATFRKTYIAKSQLEAGKKLGVSQSKISDIESCQLAPDFYVIQKMTMDYKLNFDWLATGKGNLTSDKKSGEEINVSAVLVELETLKKMLTFTQMNFNHVLKIIEKLDGRVGKLESSATNNRHKSTV